MRSAVCRKGIGLGEPERACRIRGHGPVGARRNADRPDLRTVGEAGALELLGEEAAQEDLEPLEQLLVGIELAQRVARHAVELGRGEAVAQHIVKVEVVDLVRPDQILGLLGDLSRFPDKERNSLLACQEELSRNTGMTLSICLSYGGRQEILHAVNELLKEGKTEVTAEDLEKHLYSAGIPDPDLIVRTSGEYRISNFLLWQSAYAEYYFTDVLWPDFKKEELYKALEEFAGRKRRFGK